MLAAILLALIPCNQVVYTTHTECKFAEATAQVTVIVRERYKDYDSPFRYAMYCGSLTDNDCNVPTTSRDLAWYFGTMEDALACLNARDLSWDDVIKVLVDGKVAPLSHYEITCQPEPAPPRIVGHRWTTP